MRQAMDAAAFLVDGDKRRLTGRAIPKVAAQRQDLPGRAAVAAKKNRAAKLKFGKNEPFFMAEALVPAANHDHLADFFAQRFHLPVTVSQPGQVFGQRVDSTASR
jgi:hypothetical protein